MKKLEAQVKARIRNIPDFPKKGILFRDITPLLLDGPLFRKCIRHFKAALKGKVDYVISIESRGFILGSALACELGIGFVPIRKQGKLPHTTFQTAYDLEYGQAVVEIHTDSLRKGARVIIVDDVLATGGTVKAAMALVSKFSVHLAGALFLIELKALGGRRRLKGLPVRALVTY